MTIAILSFLAALVPLVFWLLKRQAKHKDDPLTKAEKWRQQVHEEIKNDDEVGANNRFDGALFQLRMRRNANNHSSRPGAKASQG